MGPGTPLSTEAELVGVCIAMGAATRPSTLSDAERALVATAAPVAAEIVTTFIARTKAGEDALGETFCALRSNEKRRTSGAFYTPVQIVDAMVTWTMAKNPHRVVDPGCGSGRYALAFCDRGFTGEIIAIDLDPLATLMVRAAAAVREAKIEVRNESFLDTALEPLPDGQHTAFCANPPYVRHHTLGAEVKAWAKQTATQVGVKISGLAGLHALFFLAVADKTREGDFGTFITSSEWMDTVYGNVIRNLLTGPLGLERLDLIAAEASTFDDATSTALITSFTVGSADTAAVRKIGDPATLTELTGGVKVGRERLGATRRWSELTVVKRRTDSSKVELGTLFSVKRGIATGNNKYFVTTAERAAQLGLTNYTLPAATRAEDVLRANGELRAASLTKVLLSLPVDSDDPAVTAYITEGEAGGVHKRYLCAHRNPWWRVPAPTPAPILATYMARQPPTFALNTARAVNLNTLHGIRPLDDVPVEAVRGLVTWLNTNRTTLVGGRTYQGGLIKVEPLEMAGYLIPNLDELLGIATQAPT